MACRTEWRNLDSNRNVPYLNWNGDRWILNFNWLDNDFNSNDRLVRPRNLLISTPSFYKRVWFFKLISFIHPPSILPTSVI